MTGDRSHLVPPRGMQNKNSQYASISAIVKGKSLSAIADQFNYCFDDR